MPVMFLFCSFQFVILQIMLILPILQKTICGSAKKRCKYTQKPRAMQIYLHWYSDMFRGMFRYHSTQSRESNFRGESATDSRQIGALSLWKRRKKRHNAYTVGESASNSRQTGSLSWEKQTRNVLGMHIDGDRHKLIGGKCRGFSVNWFTFRNKERKWRESVPKTGKQFISSADK